MTPEPVAPEPLAPEPLAPEASRRDVERRIVSILFADLVGFTSLSETLDSEDVATIQDAYFGAVRDTIARYGGVLEKFIGDAAMAVFGLPRARDDDAERAVRAGLALIGAVERLGSRIGGAEIALRLRVGVNTGEVVTAEAGPDQGRVTGDTVNVAARFQAAADPATVLIGEATALAVADSIDVEALGGVELKGKTAPVRVWRVLRPRPERSRDAAMGRLRAPMLGRDAELAELIDALGRAATGSDPVRRLIVAPPGSGKSRLVSEFGIRARDMPHDATVLTARVRADVVAPYDAVAQLVSAAVSGRGADVTDPDAVGRVVREALTEGGRGEARAGVVATEILGLLYGGVGDPAIPRGLGDQREMRFEAWREALDDLAPGPAAWIIEDVHWAGGDLLAFIEAATAAPAPRGRLIVATARPSILESAPSFAGAAERPAHGDDRTDVTHLAPLAPIEAAALVRALVGDAIPNAVAADIAERADGNPLFIEELLRTWVSVGTLVDDGGMWRLAADPSTVQLPPTVQAIYAAQLDDLPPDARSVARRGSVAGRRFPVAALPALEVAAPDAGVAGLARRAFVSGPHADPVAGASYAYRHALLRDAGYASLARAERARLHVRMARWLETAAGGRVADVAELIGGHYAAALESAPALATAVDDDLDRYTAARLAAAWLERGAERALELAAHESARALFRRSLDLTPDQDRLDAARRWLRLGEATAFSADMDDGRALAERALETAREAWVDTTASEADRDAARSLMADASSTLGVIAWQQIRFLECRDLAQAILDEIGERDDLPTARLLVQRARGHYGETDEVEPTVRDLERGLAIAEREGDARLVLEATDSLQQVRMEHGEWEEQPWRRIADLAASLGDWATHVRALATPAIVLADDHAAEAGPLNDLAATAAEAHGLREQVGWADYRRGEFGLVSGRWDEAVSAALRAVDLAEANAYVRLGVRSYFVLVAIAAQRGDVALGERCRRFNDALPGPKPDSPYARVMLAAQDLFLADLGLREPFVPDAEARIPAYGPTPMGLGSFLTATLRIADAWLDHDLEAANRIVPAILESGAQQSATELARATADLVRAKWLHADGESNATVEVAARSALERSRKVAAPWWIARSIDSLASIGRAEAALIEEARAIRRELGIATG